MSGWWYSCKERTVARPSREALGRTLLERRRRELESFEQGRRPACKENEPQLLVIGGDGGRVQTREKDETTGSRWKEDKVLTITSCLKGDGQQTPPKKLLTTCMATMRDARQFGRLARLEAEKRGIRQAVQVIGIHDGGNWIDPMWEEHFGCHVRILDYYHAAEHLHEVARAARPSDQKTSGRLAEELVSLLWNGKIEPLLARLREFSAEAILALRSKWLSEDEESQHYWLGWPPQAAAA